VAQRSLDGERMQAELLAQHGEVVAVGSRRSSQMIAKSSTRYSLMSATGKPPSSSLPSRYSRVCAWHWVGLIWQTEDAAAIPWRSEPAAFARPDGGGSSVLPHLRGSRTGMPIGAPNTLN
jgi:hypothetical protein